jgi:hypothetical protein
MKMENELKGFGTAQGVAFHVKKRSGLPLGQLSQGNNEG